MTFQESVEYLLSLGNEVTAMKLGLENIRKLLEALGNPQNDYLKVQVAGTNGKGSVCSFLDSICRTSDITTGLFTSPHLVSITERIKINGVEISSADFARIAARVRATCEKLVAGGELQAVPTFFEQITAIALTAFSEARIDLAILETGLGGRLDATTAANAEIAAITQVDLDHQEYLGETLQEIAAEKAAIIRSDSVVIAARQNPQAEKVIADRCENVCVPLSWTPKTIEIISEETGWHAAANITTEFDFYPNIRPLKMPGHHQFQNAALAIGVAEALRRFDFVIPESAIVSGIEKAEHPGRLEFAGRYLFDGAHNPAGAAGLKRFLDDYVNSPLVMIFGSVKSKGIAEIAEILFRIPQTIILTKSANSRSLDFDEIAPYIPEEIAIDRVVRTDTVRDAIDRANEIAKPETVILVTGSLYLVGEAKEILNNIGTTVD